MVFEQDCGSYRLTIQTEPEFADKLIAYVFDKSMGHDQPVLNIMLSPLWREESTFGNREYYQSEIAKENETLADPHTSYMSIFHEMLVANKDLVLDFITKIYSSPIDEYSDSADRFWRKQVTKKKLPICFNESLGRYVLDLTLKKV